MKRVLTAAGILLLLACLFVPHIMSLELIWDGFGDAQAMCIPAELPAEAKALNLQGNPILYGNIAGVCLAVLMVTSLVILSKRGVRYKAQRIAGWLTGLACMPLHELLHAFASPAQAAVHIGIVPQMVTAYAVTGAPMIVPQVIAYFMVPCAVIGFLPLILCLILRKKHPAAAMFLYVFGMIGFIQTAPDWFSMIPILHAVPQDAVIQISEGIPYWYLQ